MLQKPLNNYGLVHPMPLFRLSPACCGYYSDKKLALCKTKLTVHLHTYDLI